MDSIAVNTGHEFVIARQALYCLSCHSAICFVWKGRAALYLWVLFKQYIRTTYELFFDLIIYEATMRDRWRDSISYEKVKTNLRKFDKMILFQHFPHLKITHIRNITHGEISNGEIFEGISAVAPTAKRNDAKWDILYRRIISHRRLTSHAEFGIHCIGSLASEASSAYIVCEGKFQQEWKTTSYLDAETKAGLESNAGIINKWLTG